MSSQRELMYLRPDIQNIMHRFITAKVEDIVPVIDLNTGEIRYPTLDAVGLDSVNVEVLESMTSVGILERSLSDRLLACPKHPDTLSISLRLYCPKCKSFDVVRMNLIEHRICGFIATREVYEKNNLICPSCKASLKEQKDIAFRGVWHECYACKGKFDSPTVMLRCRHHNHDFAINDAKKVDVYSYKLVKESEKEFYDNYILVAPLRKLLEPAGFEVEAAVSVPGKSGIAHKVTLYAHNRANDLKIIIDAKTSESEVPDQFLIGMFAKVIDIKPNAAIFAAIPSVSESSKTLAGNYGVTVVEGKMLQEVMKKIVDDLNTKLDLKITISSV